ncbi:MAG TPA: MBL fold metallo-hydrolase [Tepidiformaceae bacterium]|nr:MBL fold metallo-hydrolase [Tepidiformaceae bacterium]
MPAVERIPLGYNNVYVLEEDGQTLLVDTGPDFRGAREAIAACLGARRPDIVVATHGHSDHAGLGAWWQACGVRVALGSADVRLARGPHFSQPGEFQSFVGYVEQSGAPEHTRHDMVSGLETRRAAVRRAADHAGYPAARSADRYPTGLRFEPFEPRTALTGDTTLPAGATVLMCPGHTPGNLVLALESEGWLFSGDQLLPDITPTPGIQFVPDASGGWRRFPSLPAFTASLRHLRRMHLERCYPGHGEPFEGVAAAIDANIAQIEQRTERVFEELREAGAVSVHDLAERLYPRALRRRWWQIVATIQGHLDLLAAESRAHQEGLLWTASG